MSTDFTLSNGGTDFNFTVSNTVFNILATHLSLPFDEDFCGGLKASAMKKLLLNMPPTNGRWTVDFYNALNKLRTMTEEASKRQDCSVNWS